MNWRIENWSAAAALAVALVSAPACSKRGVPEGGSPPTGTGVYTTFYPTTYLTEQIVGGMIPVTCPLPDGADPIYWRPPREVIAAYQRADLVVINGASFEKWVTTASLSPGLVVDSARPLAGELVHYENAVVHRHGPEGEHSHEGIDGHTWLDPLNAKAQAGEILRALGERWPEHAKAFADNAADLAVKLDALHARLEKLSPPPLLASHPAYNYLVKRYGWEIDNLDLDPGQTPTGEQLDDIRARLAKRPMGLILWESEPTPAAAEKLKGEFGLRSITFSPCETAPPGAGSAGVDFLSIMNANIDRLAAAL